MIFTANMANEIVKIALAQAILAQAALLKPLAQVSGHTSTCPVFVLSHLSLYGVGSGPPPTAM